MLRSKPLFSPWAKKQETVGQVGGFNQNIEAIEPIDFVFFAPRVSKSKVKSQSSQ